MNPRAESFDHSSDPNFLAYYEKESLSHATLERFTRTRDRAIALLADTRHPLGKLDVIDIGCGAGTQARIWAELGHHVRAIDVNEPLVKIARERAASLGFDIQFDVGSATSLPYGEATADVCLMPELLEHVPDWEACIREAVRVLRPGGLLYLSTTNKLCPRQQEFNLPFYSWYPRSLKRYCEHLSVTSRPQLANYARYPAVHWFSYFALKRYVAAFGFVTLDRFDMLARQPLPPVKSLLVSAVRSLPPLRWLGHVATSSTYVWALKVGCVS